MARELAVRQAQAREDAVRAVAAAGGPMGRAAVVLAEAVEALGSSAGLAGRNGAADADQARALAAAYHGGLGAVQAAAVAERELARPAASRPRPAASRPGRGGAGAGGLATAEDARAARAVEQADLAEAKAQTRTWPPPGGVGRAGAAVAQRISAATRARVEAQAAENQALTDPAAASDIQMREEVTRDLPGPAAQTATNAEADIGRPSRRPAPPAPPRPAGLHRAG